MTSEPQNSKAADQPRRGRPPAEMPTDEWVEAQGGLAYFLAERDRKQAEADEAQSRLDRAVITTRQAGASWAQIAEALGVARQTVYKRYVTGKGWGGEN